MDYLLTSNKNEHYNLYFQKVPTSNDLKLYTKCTCICKLTVFSLLSQFLTVWVDNISNISSLFLNINFSSTIYCICEITECFFGGCVMTTLYQSIYLPKMHCYFKLHLLQFFVFGNWYMTIFFCYFCWWFNFENFVLF